MFKNSAYGPQLLFELESFDVFFFTVFKIKELQGLVHCPDKRLCLYADVTPPSDDAGTFPASITRQVRLKQAPCFLS